MNLTYNSKASEAEIKLMKLITLLNPKELRKFRNYTRFNKFRKKDILVDKCMEKYDSLIPKVELKKKEIKMMKEVFHIENITKMILSSKIFYN